MKKTFFFTSFFIISFFLNAQNVQVDWGKQYKSGSLKNRMTTFLGETNQHYFLNYQTKSENEILQFDLNHVLVNAITFKHSFKGKKLNANKILKTKNGSYLISSVYVKKEKIEYVFAAKLNRNGSLDKPTEALFSFPINKNNPLISVQEKRLNEDKYGSTLSPDSTKILFTRVNGLHENPKIESDIYQLFVFDGYLRNIWEKKIALPNSDKKIRVEDFGISNNGEVFIMTLNLITTIVNQWNKMKHFLLIRVNQDGIIAKIKIRQDGIAPLSTAVFYHQDELIVSGIYSVGQKRDKVPGGIYMMKYGKSETLIFEKKHPFSEKYKNILKPDIWKKGSFYPYDFSIRYLFIDEKNKSFLFITEDIFRQDSGYATRNFIILRLNFDGDLEWITNKKRNYSSRSGAMISYCATHRGSDIYLMYNTRKTKAEKKKIKHSRRSNFGSYYTDLIKINSDGEVISEETFLHSREMSIPIIPYLSRKIYDGNLLLLCKNEDAFQIGTMRFR